MRVTHVINDLTAGGAQSLVAELAGELCDSVRTSVVVLAGRGTLSDRVERVADEVVYLGFGRNSWRLDSLVASLGGAMRALKPDLVHSHLLQADLAVAMLGTSTPRVSTVHTTGFGREDRPRTRALARVCARASARFDAVVACSDASFEYMRAVGYRGTHHVVPNGVRIAAAPSPVPQARVLLSLARWHPMKDHATLFRALRLARMAGQPVRLVCAGGGMTAENRELAALLDELRVRDLVDLRGPVPDVSGLIDSSIGLVVSSSYGEGLPMAGAESLARGRPVLTTNVGSCRTLAVAPWLVAPPERPDLLADGIYRLIGLTGPELEDLSRRSFDLARDRFSVVTTAARYLALYLEVAASKQIHGLPEHQSVRAALASEQGGVESSNQRVA